jgi:hypothetical protein
MKKLAKLIIMLSVLVAFSGTASAAPVLFGWDKEKIIKVMDFPDNFQFKADSGEYVDAGYIYKQATIFFIPVWNYDGRWVGYIGSDTNYLQLNRSDLEEIAKSADLKLPESPSLPFWDSIGGKLLFILISLLYFGFKMMGGSEEDEEDEEVVAENKNA